MGLSHWCVAIQILVFNVLVGFAKRTHKKQAPTILDVNVTAEPPNVITQSGPLNNTFLEPLKISPVRRKRKSRRRRRRKSQIVTPATHASGFSFSLNVSSTKVYSYSPESVSNASFVQQSMENETLGTIRDYLGVRQVKIGDNQTAMGPSTDVQPQESKKEFDFVPVANSGEMKGRKKRRRRRKKKVQKNDSISTALGPVLGPPAVLHTQSTGEESLKTLAKFTEFGPCPPVSQNFTSFDETKKKRRRRRRRKSRRKNEELGENRGILGGNEGTLKEESEVDHGEEEDVAQPETMVLQSENSGDKFHETEPEMDTVSDVEKNERKGGKISQDSESYREDYGNEDPKVDSNDGILNETKTKLSEGQRDVTFGFTKPSDQNLSQILFSQNKTEASDFSFANFSQGNDLENETESEISKFPETQPESEPQTKPNQNPEFHQNQMETPQISPPNSTSETLENPETINPEFGVQDQKTPIPGLTFPLKNMGEWTTGPVQFPGFPLTNRKLPAGIGKPCPCGGGLGFGSETLPCFFPNLKEIQEEELNTYKWVCRPELFNSSSIIYSVGSNVEASFEQDIFALVGAISYTFDPTLPPHFTQIMKSLNFLHFFELGLTGLEETSNLKNISTIMAMLNHDYVDVLKIDCEGCEIAFLENLISTLGPYRKGNYRPLFGQILIEFHSVRNSTFMVKPLLTMKKLGYLLFHVEANFQCFDCMEMAYIHKSIAMP